MREYHRRKSQYSNAHGGPQVVVAQVSSRGEGNTGGIGEGMQYQNNMRNDPNYDMQMPQFYNQNNNDFQGDAGKEDQFNNNGRGAG